MRLATIYARFYRSLNYDYVRASSEGYVPDPWDVTPSGAHFPFVRLRLSEEITTVVGGNESGKSQMLRAIRSALTGERFDRSDFCRYSLFFGTDKVLVHPEFGMVLSDPSKADLSVIRKIVDNTSLKNVERIAVFRMNDTPKLRVYVQAGGAWSGPTHLKSPSLLKQLGVPTPFEIDADVPLPDSVPLEFLATGKATSAVSRNMIRKLWEVVVTNRDWFSSGAAVKQSSEEIAGAVDTEREVDERELRKFELAADLLVKVANLDRSLFVELQNAVRTKNGYANSLVDTINAELAKALNFPHWWSQDSHFELVVSLYEFDLVFMIRDRTGRSYGFDERSDGLKYFLSYFVQYLAHEFPEDGTPELLLMDEPDRFLSSSGQSDLLRIFEDFARPQDPKRVPVQVVYVTHSPFLIDKNDSSRIRVVEKGEHDEGTRIVSRVSSNHYEPLRSAFGGFVAETTFIGNCNLMVEGASDQVMLAGATRWLAMRGVSALDRLDLNTITVVPAGGTRHIPYLVYLARGRDPEKPAVIALLDGDNPGTDAREQLKAGGAYGTTLIDPDLVLQITDTELDGIKSDNRMGRIATEDLVPFDLAVEAAVHYCEELVPDLRVEGLELTLSDLYPSTDDAEETPRKNKGLLEALERAIRDKAERPDFHLDKVAFARGVVEAIKSRQRAETIRSREAATEEAPDSSGASDVNSEDSAAEDDLADAVAPGGIFDPVLAIAQENFRILLSALAQRQRRAVRAEDHERISARIKRVKREFLRTQRGSSRREQVVVLIEQISDQLDNSAESEAVRQTMREWRERFDLDVDPRSEVDDYDGLISAVDALAYQSVRRSERPID